MQPLSALCGFFCYRSSWRRLFLECPHLRFDGIYVSRNTYIRQGVSEWKRDKGVCFLVTYFRYFRFFPDGTLLYRTSPLTVSKVAKSLMRNPCQAQQKQKQQDQHVFTGRYVIKVRCPIAAPSNDCPRMHTAHARPCTLCSGLVAKKLNCLQDSRVSVMHSLLLSSCVHHLPAFGLSCITQVSAIACSAGWQDLHHHHIPEQP